MVDVSMPAAGVKGFSMSLRGGEGVRLGSVAEKWLLVGELFAVPGGGGRAL